LIQKSALAASITLVIEGEEEAGSRGLSAILPSLAGVVKGDVLLVCDTDMVNADTPSITMGLRGNIFLEVKLGGLTRDLHSGQHGGVAKNPAIELARLVATLHDDTGRIAIDGYYQGVDGPSAADRECLNKVPFDADEYKQAIGQLPLGGERALHPLERLGFQPTIEINGFHSGYGGPGSKTIIPAEASVKLTSRMVGKQDPERCLGLLRKHIEDRAPEGLTLEIVESEVGGPALLLSSEAPVISKARSVLSRLFENEPLLSWEGGSIPVVASLLKLVGGEALIVGFGLDENNIHAPNESFPLRSVRDGYRYMSCMIAELSGTLKA
jgi:acetylornithine deacetylase/succinyl-diaminopimelate desuccinylase-like protein